MIAFAAMLLGRAPRPVADLPFRLWNDHVYLAATLTGRKVNAVLDTGAGATVADDALGFTAGAKKLQAVEASGTGAKVVVATVVSGLSLRLDGTDIVHPVGVILPLAPLTRPEGRPLETVLGYDFLRRYRVEIDYAKGRVRLFPPTDRTVPLGATVLPLTLAGNRPVVKGWVTLPGLGRRKVRMMLDTGSGGAFDLGYRFARRLNLGRRYADSPEFVTGGGVGGEEKGRKIRLPSASVGGAELARPVATVETTASATQGKDAEYDVLVGGEVFRRFTMTLDYAHRRIFLRPNATYAEPFVGDRVGMTTVLGEDGGIEVKQVLPRSPASEAGVATGDRILLLDGQTPASLDEVRRRFRAARGDLRLRVRRDGEDWDLVLRTRETVP